MRADERSAVDHHDWLDEDAGPVVRPYTMTGGRAHPGDGGLDVVALVVASESVKRAKRASDASGGEVASESVARAERAGADLQPEHHAIIELAAEPISVAELAAGLDIALGVIRVLLGDLLAAGLVTVYEPPGVSYLPDEHVLKAVIDGLRSL